MISSGATMSGRRAMSSNVSAGANSTPAILANTFFFAGGTWGSVSPVVVVVVILRFLRRLVHPAPVVEPIVTIEAAEDTRFLREFRHVDADVAHFEYVADGAVIV